MDDIELLREYALRNSEEAFATLVTRHIDLVYTAAWRQVGNHHHAEEITQAVFVILAHKAKSLRPGTVLPAWLIRTARLTAANHLRAEIRRVRREQEAFMQSNPSDAPDPLWEQMVPVLNDVIDDLRDKDRSAIVLRFLQGKDYKQVAAALGATEEAAQMRVNRALEKMRKLFGKKGIAVSATVLGGFLAANGVQAAPTGLAAIISANVFSGTTITTAAVVAATKAIAMTTLQKAIVATALVATVGAGIFVAHQNSESQKRIQNLQQQQGSLNEQLTQSQRERDDATNQLDGLIAENAHLKSNSNQRELLKLRGQVAAARQAAADGAAKIRNDSEQSQADAQRNQTRASLETFFKLTNLSPEKADQYVNLEVEMKRRQNERMKGLLNGTLSVADAVRERDQDKQAQEDQRRELLGPDGWATLQSIADDMRNGTAKRLTDAAQSGMGNNSMTQEQTARLQSAIKAEFAANTMDDVDLFRPVDEWTRMVTDSQQHVVQAASEFLTPAQQQTFEYLVGANLKQLLQQREQRRKLLGINQ